MEQLTNILQTLVPSDPATILALLGSGAGVAIALQVIKHFGKLKEAKKTVVFLLAFLSFVATFADAVIQFAGQNPKLVVGDHLGTVIAFAVIVHRFAVSPAYYKVTSQLEQIRDNKEDATAYRATQLQAATPVTPVEGAILASPHEFSL